MIYLDTSVALAQLLAEDVQPPEWLWSEPLASSRLLQYEVWTRLNVRRLAASHAEAAHDLLGRVAFLELSPSVLARALEPFPLPLRTLDALHLASLEYLRQSIPGVRLAAYDGRLRDGATRLGVTMAL